MRSRRFARARDVSDPWAQAHPAASGSDTHAATGMDDGAASIPVVTGFRLVRRLGRGARCDVFLAIASDPAGPRDPTAAATATVALKIERSTGSDRLLREADALSRVRHPHVLALLDIAQVAPGHQAGPLGALDVTAPGSTAVASTLTGSPSWGTASCLVLERVPRDSLAVLLASRATLRLGEAITILAPVSSAVDALHRSGVAHGAISASSVLFRESGAPVLSRFGSATLFTAGLPAAALDSRAEVLVDRAALVRLVMVVLARVEAAALPPEDELAGRLPAEIVDWLFALGTPEPIEFVPRLAALDGDYSARTTNGQTTNTTTSARTTANADAAGRGRAGDREDAAAAQTLPAFVPRLVAAARQLASSVRPGFWITAGLVALALVVAVLAIPAGSSRDDGRAASASPEPVRTARAPGTAAPGTPRTGGSPALRSDDPVTALEALVEARAECYRQVSVRCLAEVDQAGSAALAADVASIRTIQEGGELSAVPGENVAGVRLVQGLGDTALLRAANWSVNSEPASILIMRTEAGWRIRDYLEE